ncbi:class I SAM-dependent methyltransferase [Immundisolibacter cernigliae]|uniref:class I SAM-dependent methyltransferase n=1 Tax=Immundisolibacter cernigliae TaxID=1810504 RepID=UPI00096AD7B5|nr:class I SAM-dependent methyltransferase [Immundisolibacter cernigliae]
MSKILKFLYGPIRPILKKILLDCYIESIAKNINLELGRHALRATAHYVAARMSMARSYARKFDLYDDVISRAPVTGLWLEFGVYTGETINYIAGRASSVIYGFDSFEGLPENWRDGFPKGHFSLGRLPTVKGNVELVTGWFDETLPNFLSEHPGPISFLHIDCDLYSSTKVVFDLCQDRIVPGTIIVFDEYFNYPGWEEGEFKAFQEFVSIQNLEYEYIGYVFNHEQVAICIVGKES